MSDTYLKHEAPMPTGETMQIERIVSDRLKLANLIEALADLHRGEP